MGCEVSIKDAKNRFSELARSAEAGETIVITRNGKPVVDLVPHVPPVDFGRDRYRAWLKMRGYSDGKASLGWVSPNFDDALSEDFLSVPQTADFWNDQPA